MTASCRYDIAIAGAGIIGLATALELARAGQRVVVFDAGRAMRESSWAAAGMLAAWDAEWDRENPEAMRGLAALSLGLYPEFLAQVEQASGRAIPVRTRKALQAVHAAPAGKRVLEPSEIASAAPGIVAGCGLLSGKFVEFAEESIDPRDLAGALPLAAQAVGVEIRECVAVEEVRVDGERCFLRTTAGEIAAEQVVYAAGPWTGQLCACLAAAVGPRKGQMILVELPGRLQTECVLRTAEIYIVPRGADRYGVGATVEDAGFDKSTSGAAGEALLAAAARLWPPLREARVVDAWAGLRPGTADELPVIGGCGPRQWVATGHFRNGILLAPATARVLRERMMGEPVSVDIEAFRCDRFALSRVHA